MNLTEPNLNDNLDELLDTEQEYGQAWKPSVGDKLIGELIRYGKYHGDFGDTFYAVIRDDEGELHSVYLNSTVLANRFTELRPKPGERIGIKRLESGGKNYKRFNVVVNRPGAVAGSIEPNWDELAKAVESKTENKPEIDSDVPF